MNMDNWENIITRNSVGQAMQRAFDSRGVFEARYSDVIELIDNDISQPMAQPHIDHYNQNVGELRGYR
jgi:hypothetical protein